MSCCFYNLCCPPTNLSSTLSVRQAGHIGHQQGSTLKVNWVLCAYVSARMCDFTHMPLLFFILCLASFYSPSSSSIPHSPHSSFTASRTILFLSVAEFRADKGVEGSGGSDIMGFRCQIGIKSSLWARRRAVRGSLSQTPVEEMTEVHPDLTNSQWTSDYSRVDPHCR